MDNHLVNYQNWTEKGRHRVAVFGWTEDTILHILEVHCSHLDQFQKKVAVKVYENYRTFGKRTENPQAILMGVKYYHPIYNNRKIKDGDSAKYTLMEYCKSKFNKRIIYEKLVDSKISSVRIKKKTVNGTIIEFKTYEQRK